MNFEAPPNKAEPIAGTLSPTDRWFGWFLKVQKAIATSLTVLTSSQAANTVFAGPAAGPAAVATFRALVTADMPGINAVITTAKLTAGGANGSMTFVNGVLTAQTPAT